MKLHYFAAAIALAAAPAFAEAADYEPIVLDGGEGPGKGKHIVLISGDQEYRSEETIPQLAKILSKHHGFKCTVLFTVDPKSGAVNPNIPNIPGLKALEEADLMVIFTRLLKLPDEQMQHFDAYLQSGKPVVGLRTATHAFSLPADAKYARYGNDSSVKGWEGGFGKVILGEKWVAHHGAHGVQGTRGIFAKDQEEHAILKGIAPGEIFGTTDVYTVNLPLPGDSTPIVLGEVTESLKPDSKAAAGKKNDPMMPVAWTKTYEGWGTGDAKKVGRVFTTTMGASQDFDFEGTRRMIVNGCYWALGLEEKIPEKSKVEIVGEFKPTPFRFKKAEEWTEQPMKPADYFK